MKPEHKDYEKCYSPYMDPDIARHVLADRFKLTKDDVKETIVYAVAGSSTKPIAAPGRTLRGVAANKTTSNCLTKIMCKNCQGQ